MPHSGVQLKCDRSGGITVFCGSTDIGQGSDSILAYIVAEVLGIDPFEIRVVTADTDLTPVDLGSYSSRVTLMTGHAAMQAAERAREIIVPAVVKKLDIPSDRVVFADGRVFDAEDPARGMSFAEAVRPPKAPVGTIGAVGSYTPPRRRAAIAGRASVLSAAYSYCGVRGGSGSRSRHGDRAGAHDLDRARHRALHQPRAGHGTGRRQRVHGPG